MNPLCILDGIIHHVRYHINERTVRRRGISEQSGDLLSLPEISSSLPSEESETVIFAAADHKYLTNYGPGFVDSIGRVSDHLRVHLHAMLLAGEECEPLLEDLRDRLQPGRMTFSTEQCEAPPENWHLNAQFFQVRRFHRLAELMSLGSYNVLSVDIDTVFLQSPEFVANEWPNHDLLLQVNLGPLRPTPVTCACMWLRPTPRVRQILSQASSRMRKHAQTGFFVDHIDERCLTNELYKQDDLEIVALPDSFCSTKPNGAFIFDGVGDEKKRLSPVFAERHTARGSADQTVKFRRQCIRGDLRKIHKGKAWNKEGLVILWRRILE